MCGKDFCNMSYASEMMEIWEMVKEQLKLKFGSTAVDLWFGELKMESFRDNALTFSTKSEFKYKIIKDKYIKPIEEFRKLLAMGLTPILPHPERYFYLSHRELMKFVEAGVLIQCNYGSLAGLYGEEVRDRTCRLISEGVVSTYGTDMHNLRYAEIIGRWFGEGNKIVEF